MEGNLEGSFPRRQSVCGAQTGEGEQAASMQGGQVWESGQTSQWWRRFLSGEDTSLPFCSRDPE